MSGDEFAMRKRELQMESGFTLLEVLVALTLMAVGAAVVMSLLSGSAGNIRKAQLRTKIIEQAETVLEQTLLDDTILNPTSSSGVLDDGSGMNWSWTVTVEEYVPPVLTDQIVPATTQALPVKLLQYTVKMISPDAQVSDYTLQTLKVVNATTSSQ
jgi:type II secretion system protein I